MERDVIDSSRIFRRSRLRFSIPTCCLVLMCDVFLQVPSESTCILYAYNNNIYIYISIYINEFYQVPLCSMHS